MRYSIFCSNFFFPFVFVAITSFLIRLIHAHDSSPTFSLQPPFSNVQGNLINSWEFGGSASIVDESYLRLTPYSAAPSVSSGKSIGWIWNTQPFPGAEWEVEFKFRTTNSGGEGFAFWYISKDDKKKEGNAMGNQIHWEGLGVFFDSINNDGQGPQHPLVAGVVNDGKKNYFGWEDGASIIQANCQTNFRTSPGINMARVLYSHGFVRVNVTDGGIWKECFHFPAHLPTGYYFGFTAMTGDHFGDEHDLLSVQTFNRKSNEQSSSNEQQLFERLQNARDGRPHNNHLNYNNHNPPQDFTQYSPQHQHPYPPHSPQRQQHEHSSSSYQQPAQNLQQLEFAGDQHSHEIEMDEFEELDLLYSLVDTLSSSFKQHLSESSLQEEFKSNVFLSLRRLQDLAEGLLREQANSRNDEQKIIASLKIFQETFLRMDHRLEKIFEKLQNSNQNQKRKQISLDEFQPFEPSSWLSIFGKGIGWIVFLCCAIPLTSFLCVFLSLRFRRKKKPNHFE